MQRGFALLPVLVVVAFVVVTAGVFYALGRGSVAMPKEAEDQRANSSRMSALPSATPGHSGVPSVNATIAPNPDLHWNRIQIDQTVEYFPAYSVAYPDGWNFTKKSFNADGSEIVLTKGGNTITITQGAGDGGGCLFGEVKEGMYSQYISFTEFKKKNAVWRRVQLVDKSNGVDKYGICAKNKDSNDFNAVTLMGWIDIDTPGSKPDVLVEVDQILDKLSY